MGISRGCEPSFLPGFSGLAMMRYDEFRPLMEGESEEGEDIKKGKCIIAWSSFRRILTKTAIPTIQNI
jgi:hypothetical protein